MRFSIMAAAVAVALLSAPAQAQYVPVGGDGHDACASNGRVTGLDPKGDNVVLPVRKGPGLHHAEIDTIGMGRELFVCRERDGWYGVVYGEGNCGVTSPISAEVIYEGPCGSGWVSRHHVEITAG